MEKGTMRFMIPYNTYEPGQYLQLGIHDLPKWKQWIKIATRPMVHEVLEVRGDAVYTHMRRMTNEEIRKEIRNLFT